MAAGSGPGRPYVAVVGPGTADPGVTETGHAVGAGLARRGAVLVCGGRGGLMEAACRGAKEAGGTTVGILPGLDRADANEFVDVAIATGIGDARNALVVRAADALIAVAGGFGTLTEIAFALVAGKPAIGLGTWKLERGGGSGEDPIVRASTPEEAVEAALRLAAGGSGPRA